MRIIKKSVLISVVGTILLIGLSVSTSDETAAFRETDDGLLRTQLINEVNSLSRLLYELAAERYWATSNQNETLILTFHEGRSLMKYTDGKYTVASFPMVQETDRISLSRYTAQYNVFNVRDADLKVEAAKYEQARELYRLVAHFTQDDPLLKDRIEKKLLLVDRLEHGKDFDKTLQQFRELSENLGTPMHLFQVETLPPTIVTNLLTIQLP